MGKSMDIFCWLCEGSINGKFDHQCVKCGRAHHYQCQWKVMAKKWPKPWYRSQFVDLSGNTFCLPCQHMQKSAICEPTLKNSTNSAIIIAVEKLMKMDTDNFFRGPINWNVEVSIDLVNPIDLYSIKIKANSNLYESADEFLYDIRMIHHNAIIILGKNDQLTKTIEEICHQAFDDYCGITYCVGCYIKASMDPNFYKSDDFLQPCIPAHGLVWAQKSGDSPDYPAKIIKYYPEKYCPEKKMVLKNIIDVCFFGSREIFTELKIDMCFLLSKQRPNSSIISKEFAFQLSSDVKKHTSLLENLKANQPDAVTQIFYSDETELDITKMYLPNNLKKQDMSKIVPSSEIGEITDNTSNKRIRTLTNESKIKELEEEVSALKSKLEIANRKIKELKKGRKSEAKRESIYALCDNTKKIDEQENIASSEPKNAAKKADEQVNIAKSNLQNNLTGANNKIESLENILNNKKKVKQDLCCRVCLKLSGLLHCCGSTYYCSVDCQKKHLLVHYKSCTKLKEMIDRDSKKRKL